MSLYVLLSAVQSMCCLSVVMPVVIRYVSVDPFMSVRLFSIAMLGTRLLFRVWLSGAFACSGLWLLRRYLLI